MEIDFERLRRDGISAYNDLIKELNRHVHGERFGPGIPQQDIFCTHHIKSQLDDLRDFMVVVMCMEGDESNIETINDMELGTFDPENR